jgi:NADPH-dependent glutamate synthase beta subunit-like oxidoreductase/glutamate synthase domain-containing protein 3/NAD-dependent dihydropyrimidine dehydrogenase PreA subunit
MPVKKKINKKPAVISKQRTVKPKAKTAPPSTAKIPAAAITVARSVKAVEFDAVKKTAVIYGIVDDKRVSSRILEERIQQAVKDGARDIKIKSDGQHGMGGRIWPLGETIKINIEGPAGQRVGSMGMDGTEIVINGSSSDDTGWINCGAKITVLGDVTNGAFNAAAQGILYVQGGGAARCDTLTKRNPRFEPPQSWYFRNVGDSFAEFKAGGIAVVCGVEPRNPDNILGYRPCVGMVGGIVYFRGKIQGYSERDVKLLDLTPQDWEWLTENMKPYLSAIDRMSYYKELTSSLVDWKKLIPFTPQEKGKWKSTHNPDMAGFRKNSWEKGVGDGGIFSAYLEHDRTLLPYITTGNDRRNKPLWANEKFLPPCAFACPTKIPTHKRTALIRAGKLNEALELVLQYSPLPATVCGEICPNLCMESCSRSHFDKPLDIDRMGSLALDLPAPAKAKATGHKIAVIGGGPAGMSAAWQLGLKGHSVDIYEASDKLGGKIEMMIPRERLPQAILQKEISRFKEIGVNTLLNTKVDKAGFEKLYNEHEIIIVACGAHKPRIIPIAGSEHVVSAYEFLKNVNLGKAEPLTGKKVVVIGSGNVGMDAASEAYNHGAESVIAIDVQKPAAFGIEVETAVAKGTQILWPRFTEKFDHAAKKLWFKDGTSIDADVVIMSIGDVPILDFLPPSVNTEKGWLAVNENYQTSDVKVFAIGDATQLGLVTHSIGQGRIVSDIVNEQLMHAPRQPEMKTAIAYDKIKEQYYEVCKDDMTLEKVGESCMSCGTCRDCHMCESTCYQGAISRKEDKDGNYEYVVDENKCIGCSFCAGICPCGVWEMVENI